MYLCMYVKHYQIAHLKYVQFVVCQGMYVKDTSIKLFLKDQVKNKGFHLGLRSYDHFWLCFVLPLLLCTTSNNSLCSVV